MRPAVLPDLLRARTSDPDASHAAAEAASLTLKQVRFAVLWIVAAQPSATGKQINDFYRTLQPKLGWPLVDGDSPRRRAGELAKDGYLERVEQEQARNNRPVGHYTVSGRGVEAMENWT